MAVGVENIKITINITEMDMEKEGRVMMAIGVGKIKITIMITEIGIEEEEVEEGEEEAKITWRIRISKNYDNFLLSQRIS